MASEVTKRYRIGGRFFTLRFVPNWWGSKWKIYADEHPPDPWGKGVGHNHLYASGEVCVAAGKEPGTLDRAIAIGQVWAHGWVEYCRTGEFPKGPKRVNV